MKTRGILVRSRASGSTGDSPVRSGDPPDGTGGTTRAKGNDLAVTSVAAVPLGESPSGAGGSPALPLFSTRPHWCSFVSIRGCRSAFTLTELLTVIAILGVLAGLVLEAFSTAQARAYRIACVSNLKQFGVALQLYANDHDDRLPPNADGREEALGAKWVEGWLGLPGPDCTNTLYLRRSLLGPYVGDPKLWRCPSAEPVKVGSVTIAADANRLAQLLHGLAGKEPGGDNLSSPRRGHSTFAGGDDDFHRRAGGNNQRRFLRVAMGFRRRTARPMGSAGQAGHAA